METSKSRFDLKNNFILPLVVFVITAPLAAFIGNKFGPKNLDKDILMVQLSQVKVLNDGFSNIVNTLNKKGPLDPAVVNQINIYSSQFSQFVKTANDIAGKYELNVTPIDTVAVKLISKQYTEESPVPVTSNELKISAGDNNLTQIDEINSIAIKKEHPETGSITIMLNGSQTSIGKGGNRVLKDGAGKEFKFYYKGKFGDEYVFLIQK